MQTNKMLAYILNNHDLEWRSTVYPFRNSGIAAKQMAFELFHQIESNALPVRLMVVSIDDEASGVALAIGDEETIFEDFPEKLKTWAQHNFACEPRVYHRDGEYWYGPRPNGKGKMKLFIGNPLLSNQRRKY
ncbi:hypothetical protein BDV93DRAFT_544078 [Ceratobasidium sp. AG-I]|nr:hypothetical protein BDV93DRAFT_544078 [Ceratobasidium sp. AG-I]